MGGSRGVRGAASVPVFTALIQKVHVEVDSVFQPGFGGYVSQAGAGQHEVAFPVGEAADHSGSAAYLLHDALEHVVGVNAAMALPRELVAGKALTHFVRASLNPAGCPSPLRSVVDTLEQDPDCRAKLHGLQLSGDLFGFRFHLFGRLLDGDGFEHGCNGGLYRRRDLVHDLAMEVEHAALPFGHGVDFGQGFHQTGRLVGDD